MSHDISRIFMISAAFLICWVTAPAYDGHRTDALDNAVWNVSEWISARDAAVVTTVTKANTRSRRCDSFSHPARRNPVKGIWERQSYRHN